MFLLNKISSSSYLPAPSMIGLMWSFGSLVGLFFSVQIITGVLLASTYLFNEFTFFTTTSSQIYLDEFLRYLHANGASFIFIFMYIHIGRGLYYMSYKQNHTWMIGVTILFLMMATAFLGYILPSNQMSYWGASVITSLVSEIPYFGPTLMNFLWGDWMVSTPLYSRFFSLHYFFPFIITAMIFMHFMFLHNKGSSNSLGTKRFYKIEFMMHFIISDMVIFLFMFCMSLSLALLSLNAWDSDVFSKSETFITPNHIQPEWYFLFAYAILRAIPNKLGGVISLVLAIAILYLFPLLILSKSKSSYFYTFYKTYFWVFITMVFLLTWIGAMPAESPYIMVSRVYMFIYFFFIFMSQMSMWIWDIFLTN